MTNFGRCIEELGRSAARIGALGHKVEYASIFPEALNVSHVDIHVRWDYNAEDDMKRAWANLYVERHGGTVTEAEWYEGSRVRLTIKHTTFDGLMTAIITELSVKSEPEGEESVSE